MDLTVVTQLIALIQSHQWVPLTALVIGLVIRLLKDDTILPTIPSPVRKWGALGLGALAGIVRAMVGGMPLVPALLAGLAAALTAMAGHDVIVEGMRRGKEIAMPKFLLRKPPDGPGSVTTRISGLLIFIVGLSIGGCASLQSGAAAVCQIIDSGNPIIGSICLNLPEIESVITHVKASRSVMKSSPETKAVDICAASVGQ